MTRHGMTVVELHAELGRRIVAGQGRAPVTMWVADTSDPDHSFDRRASVRHVVPPDESFPEVQLWGTA